MGKFRKLGQKETSTIIFQTFFLFFPWSYDLERSHHDLYWQGARRTPSTTCQNSCNLAGVYGAPA